MKVSVALSPGAQLLLRLIASMAKEVQEVTNRAHSIVWDNPDPDAEIVINAMAAISLGIDVKVWLERSFNRLEIDALSYDDFLRAKAFRISHARHKVGMPRAARLSAASEGHVNIETAHAGFLRGAGIRLVQCRRILQQMKMLISAGQ